MEPYLAVLGLTAVFAGIATAISRGFGYSAAKWGIFDIPVLGLLILFSGSRVGVGTDYGLYVSLWAYSRTDDLRLAIDESPQSAGFAAMQFFLKRINENPQTLFWVTAAITVVAVLAAIKKASPDVVLSLVLYVALGSYLLPFNVLRQGLAAAILFYAAVSYLDSRQGRYVALSVVATLLHPTAVLPAVLFLLVRNWQPLPKTAVKIVGLGLLVALLFSRFADLSTLVARIDPRYDIYVAQDQAGVGTYLTIAAKAALLLFCYTRRDQMNSLHRRYLLFATFGLAALIVGTQSQVLARLDLYFALFLILALPAALATVKDFAMRAGLVIASGVYMTVLLQNYANLLPYQTTFIGHPDPYAPPPPGASD